MINSRKNSSEDSRKSKYNLWRFHGDAAASAVDEAAGNYQSPSIIAAGANAQSVTVLTTAVNLCLSLVCIKAPALIESVGKTKKGAITLAFLNICAWVPLIIAFFLSPFGIQPVWFALLWLVNIMPGLLLTFQRDNWISNVVPKEKLGRYLGQRLAIKSAFYLGAFCFLGYLLDSLGSGNLVNFAVVFSVALAVAMVDFMIYTFMYDPKKPEDNLIEPVKQKIKFGLFNYIGELKAKKLDTFIIFTSLFYLTVGLSGPLYAVYMLQEQHFTYFSFTIIIGAEYLARVISAPFWGRFADRSGNIRVLSIVSRIIPAIPICWLFSANIGYLAVVQTLSGICWGAFDLCTQNYIYKVAPAEKKLRYIVYTRCLVLFATALGGLGSVYLLRGIFPIFGSKMLTVFMISGFFRVIVVMLVMPKLVDLAVSYYQPGVTPKVDLDTSGKVKVSKHGLFYHRHEPVVVFAKNPLQNPDMMSPPKPYNIARRRDWTPNEKPKEVPMKQNGTTTLSRAANNMPRGQWMPSSRIKPEKKESFQKEEIMPTQKPWFGDPDVLHDYNTKNKNQAEALLEKKNRETSHKEGIARNHEVFNAYNTRRQNESQAMTEKKNRETANREGNLYNPEMFSAYKAKRQSESQALAAKKNRETANREGHLHDRGVLKAYNTKRQNDAQEMIEKHNRETANREGHLHSPDAFDTYHTKRQNDSRALIEKHDRETSNKDGLFYSRPNWAKYRQASLRKAVEEKQSWQPEENYVQVFPEGSEKRKPGMAGTDIRKMMKLDRKH